MKQLLAGLFVTLLTACGASIDTDGFASAPCDLGVSDLQPSASVDYVTFGEAMDYFGPGRSVESGTACSGATDPDACQAALDELRPDSPWVVTTAGDEVSAYTTYDEVVGFLGAIDTTGEAVLLAAFSGYQVGCDAVDEGGVRAAGDGFEVVAVEVLQRCGPEKTQQVLLQVDADGAIEVLERGSEEKRTSACP